MVKENNPLELHRRYVEARDSIDRDLESDMAFTSIRSQYKDCSGDEILLDLFALDYDNERMHDKLNNIIDKLDTFLRLDEAKEMQDRQMIH